MKAIAWFIGAWVLATSVALLTGRADEEKVALDKVPKGVLETVKTRFAGAELLGATKESADGKTVYEITIKYKGAKTDVIVTPEGSITLIEKEIAAKDLPAAVAKTLADKYPKATYKIVEEITKVENKQEKLAYYEVLLVTADKKELEVQVDPSGKFLNEEKKDGKNDKD